MLQSQNYGRLLEPSLRKIFFNSYKEIPEQYSKVFNVQNSSKAIETDYRMGGFGLFEKKDSAGSIQYQDPTGTQALQYIHEEFASGYTVERKLIDDEQYGQIGKFSAALGRSARATIETRAADVLNTSFTTNGFDGQPLFSTTHKNLDGSTQSNRLIADSLTGATADGALSDRNLKAALVQMRATKDDKGILIQTIPSILVVPPQLEYIAKTLIGSSNISAQGTGSGMTNDVNVLQSRLSIAVMDYWTYTASAGKYPWFLLDPTTAQLNFFWRKKLEFNNDRDFDTHQYKYSAYMRFSAGYSDFRGVFGSNGTGAA